MMANEELKQTLNAGIKVLQYARNNCRSGHGKGEIPSNAFDEPPEPCQHCGAYFSVKKDFEEQLGKVDELKNIMTKGK